MHAERVERGKADHKVYLQEKLTINYEQKVTLPNSAQKQSTQTETTGSFANCLLEQGATFRQAKRISNADSHAPSSRSFPLILYY